MENTAGLWTWIGFTLFLVGALSIDTFLLKNAYARPGESLKAALAWTIIWIVSALIFNVLLWFYLHQTATPAIANEKALAFFTGYLIEKMLSFDNLFAFYMIFHQLRIPVKLQQRVFSIGIWSAIVFRLLLILIGSSLIAKYHWLIYVMGAFLLLTGIKMLFAEEKKKDLAMTKTVPWLHRHLRFTSELQGQRFFIKKNNLVYATPLVMALIFIQFADVVFAFDSIPAIFAITTDPFIIWTSNIFAILGLRALYFILAGMVDRFYFLKYGIALILVFIGAKMILEPWLHISVLVSLITVFSILIFFVGLSIFYSAKRK